MTIEQVKYRPFNGYKECFLEMQRHEPFGLVKLNINGELLNLISFGIFHIGVSINFKDKFNEWTFTDGLPFGIKEN